MSNDELFPHRIPAEDMVLKKQRKAELEFMKELFFDKLPVGENTEHITEYFNELEKVIFTKNEQVGNEDFESIDREPGAIEREYTYISPSLFKEYSSRLLDGGLPQEMGTPTIANGIESPTPGGHEESKSLPPIPEHGRRRSDRVQELFGDDSDSDCN